MCNRCSEGSPEHQGTVFSYHIEEPKLPFFVRFFYPGYFNVFWHEERTRTVRVLAETSEGALKLAKYHYGRGSNFELVTQNESQKQTTKV